MSKKMYQFFGLLIAISMLLSACAPAAPAPAPEVAVAEPTVQVATVAPVVEPTAIPEVAPDFTALFKGLISELPADKGYGTIAATALNEAMVEKAPFLLDVRETAEVEKDGYITGSVNLPVRSLLQNLDKLPDLDEPIVIYCASGHRGGFAMAALKLLGYTDVKNLAGGLAAWKKAELAVETGKPEEAASISKPIVADQALFTALDGFLAELPDGFYATKSDKLNEDLGSSSAPVLIDVRRENEYASNGYIEGAVNLPLETIMDNLDKLPADKATAMVIYCVSGHRASIATMSLHLLGYENVINLGGGFNAWKAAQLPIVGWVDWTAVWGEFLSTLPANMYSISSADLNTQLAEKTPFLLDVREASELEKNGSIAGAVHIPVRDVLKNLDKLPAMDQPIVIYCASGHRGALAMAALRFLGYTDVLNLGGGLGAWLGAKLPVETGSMPEAPAAGTAPTVDETRLRDLDAYLSGLPEGFGTVSATDLNAELGGSPAPFLLDVRTAEEITKDGAIEGGVNVPIVDLFASMDQLPKDKAAPVVIYCKSGHRGGLGMMALQMTGYTNVRNLGGGLGAWVKAELPVVK